MGITIKVNILLTSNHHIIVQANQLQTGSQIMVAAQKTVVIDVKIIGVNLTYQAFNSASFIVNQLFFKIFIYSINIIAFQTTIHANAITHIIDVAEKYSQFNKYSKLNHGKTPKNHNKNVIIIIPAIQKEEN
jgi:hypothetical protein